MNAFGARCVCERRSGGVYKGEFVTFLTDGKAFSSGNGGKSRFCLKKQN